MQLSGALSAAQMSSRSYVGPAAGIVRKCLSTKTSMTYKYIDFVSPRFSQRWEKGPILRVVAPGGRCR